MKIYRRLLLLAVFSVPLLSGCGGSSGDNNPNPKSNQKSNPATFGAATFDNATWN